ncbi:hypothetical protein OnM2_007014 [Erysiphe neolycopersici]|uniref:Uncharacterized protein n=1 Tax=Erysiphe neolycopersici TaxID=212602 RepID=A0A420I784_9PEZI|nr:hypothetical protein OnM2_007014 [Erysiphe neolycopersici]
MENYETRSGINPQEIQAVANPQNNRSFIRQSEVKNVTTVHSEETNITQK